MQHREASFKGAGEVDIHYQQWAPEHSPRGLIVLVHGAAEHSGRYRRFAEHFANLGYATAALDHIGHGRSEGQRGYVRNFGEYVETLDRFVQLLKGEFAEVPRVLLGHSMGGLIASCYLLQNQDDFVGCVLSGPAIKTDLEPPIWQRLLIQFFSMVAPRMGVLQLDASGVSRDPLEVREYLDDPLVYGGKLTARKVSQLFAAMQWIQEQASDIRLPLLLMHGEADMLTSPSGSRYLYEHVSSEDKTLKLYPGLFHEIFNEPERLKVFEDLQDWLDQRLERRHTEETIAQDYILYGGEISLYTGKARAYLRFKQLPFEERIASREVYKNIILPNVGAPIIPVLATPGGELVQDTTEIIDFLEARHPEPSVYPPGPRQKLVALMLEHYGDEWLVIPAMHYRWSFLDQQQDFIFGEFGALSAPDASREEQIAIGEKTSKPFRGSIPMLGVNESTVAAIEAEWHKLMVQLEAHFAEHPFLLGSRPSIADFGFMGPLYAHLGRDPVPRALMEAKAPRVYDWVCRMNAPASSPGEFLPDDQVAETLIPILETLCRDFLPDVVGVIAQNAAFMASNPGEKIPRYLGMHRFRTGDAESERVVHSYSQWMFQRAFDHYQGLGEEDRVAVDALLERIGGLEAMRAPLPRRVRRQPGQLELVEATDAIDRELNDE
jgi:alpha-beta hydrolase superfamily lysophospholipase/glutathione S-transferase